LINLFELYTKNYNLSSYRCGQADQEFAPSSTEPAIIQACSTREESIVSTQIIVELPEDVFRRATQLAQLTSRPLADVLVDTLTISLPTLAQPESVAEALAELTDEQIMRLVDLTMDPADDRRLSQLLHQQQAGSLSEVKQRELARLMQLYQAGLLRKAQALAEAVKRGLHPPLTP
jgi:hypothetical protein